MSRPVLCPIEPPIQWIPEFLPGGKRLGREVDPSPSSGAEAINKLSYSSASPTSPKPSQYLRSIARIDITSLLCVHSYLGPFYG